MAVYTDLSDQDAATLLARYDLGALVSLKGIAEGVENSNFLLEAEAGRFILTLYERRARREDLPYFLGLMGRLAEAGFPCPTPIADRGGRILQEVKDRAAALVAFLPGVSAGRPDAEQCREAGTALARLHLAGRGFEMRRANDLGPAAWPGLFAGRGAAAEALRPGLAGEIAQDLEEIVRAWPADLPAGPIHADLFPDNVFFLGGRFSAAIDFYFACDDFYAYDLAVCLNAWCFPEEAAYDPDRGRALVGGYETIRPLETEERGALPVLARGAAMRFLLTRLVDWTRRDEGALVRPKNPLDYARRLDHHRRRRADPDPLELS